MIETPEFTLSQFDWDKNTNILWSKTSISAKKIRVLGSTMTKTFIYFSVEYDTKTDRSYRVYVSDCGRFKIKAWTNE